jgi:hypothetical protein
MTLLQPGIAHHPAARDVVDDEDKPAVVIAVP